MGKSTLYGENLLLTLGNVFFIIMSIVTVVLNNIVILLVGSGAIGIIIAGIYFGMRLHLYQTVGGLSFLNARIIFPDMHIQEEIIGISDYIELDIDNEVNIESWADWDAFKTQILNEMARLGGKKNVE